MTTEHALDLYNQAMETDVTMDELKNSPESDVAVAVDTMQSVSDLYANMGGNPNHLSRQMVAWIVHTTHKGL